MSHFQTIIYDKQDNIAYITLNRPQVLNIYNITMRDELYEVLLAIKNDDEVRVAILKGAGEKAFCAGADLSEFLTSPSPVISREVRFKRDIWGLFLSLPQPVIGALHGYILGSGFEMALYCDLRIVADDAWFGLPEVSLGIIPAAGATQTLPRVVGRAKAKEMLLTGRWIDAKEGMHIGLANKVVPREQLLPTAKELALRISGRPEAAIRYAKRAVTEGLNMPLINGLALEKRLVEMLTGVN